MIPPRIAPFVIALLLSGGMSFLVSGLATFRAVGAIEGFLSVWMSSWVFAWAVAFPALLVLKPLVTKFVMSQVRQSS